MLSAIIGTAFLLNTANSANFIKDNSTNNVALTNTGAATYIASNPFTRGSTTLAQRQLSDGTLEICLLDEITIKGGSVAQRLYSNGNMQISGIFDETAISYRQYTANSTVVIPNPITSINIATIGGGGGGRATTFNYAGGGGGFAWVNNVTVTPGTAYTVYVGLGGVGVGNGGAGGCSYVAPLSSVTTFTASCSGTTLTTSISQSFTVGTSIFSGSTVNSGQVYLGTIVSGSGTSWTVSIGGTYASQIMTAANVLCMAEGGGGGSIGNSLGIGAGGRSWPSTAYGTYGGGVGGNSNIQSSGGGGAAVYTGNGGNGGNATIAATSGVGGGAGGGASSASGSGGGGGVGINGIGLNGSGGTVNSGGGGGSGGQTGNTAATGSTAGAGGIYGGGGGQGGTASANGGQGAVLINWGVTFPNLI